MGTSLRAMLFSIALVVPLVAQESAPSDEREQKFIGFLKAGELDSAIELIAEATAADPKQDQLASMRMRVASALASKGRNDEAIEQMNQLLEYRLGQIDRAETAPALVSALSMADSILRRGGKQDKAAEWVDHIEKVLGERVQGSNFTPYHTALGQLARLKAQKFRTAGRLDEALSVLESSLRSAQELLVENSDSTEAAINVVQSYQGLMLLQEGDQQKKTFEELKSFVLRRLGEKSNGESLLSNYISCVTSYASQWVRSDPLSAESLITETRRLADDYKATAETSLTALDNSLKMLDRLDGMIASSKKLLELIGNPAPALDAEHWINVEPTSLEKLHGKVVLLDFWAVWCGPCIATFPHLKHLEQEYGPQGLQIIGVTNRYNYAWNEEANRAIKADDEVSTEDELAMLKKFLAFHELKHGTIVAPKGSQMQEEYGVSGIPHAVVIDKAGAVRLIKVGSGEKNASEIEAMVQKLLAE